MTKLPKNTMTRFVYRCPSCGAKGSTYLGGRVLCTCGATMTMHGTEVLVRRPNGRRVWKRPWNVRSDEQIEPTE